MGKMIAMVVREPGGSLEREERAVPVPGDSEILIRVEACGMCHSDAIVIGGLSPTFTYPRIPGHEVIGVVEAVGRQVQGWAPGDRAGVGWFGGSCGHCRACRRFEPYACEAGMSVTGGTRDGGYATHMVADAASAAHVPEDLDMIASAPLLCAGITTFNALRNSGARAGETVVVHGVGGLGHLAIQFAARLGYRTVAVNRGAEKAGLAHALGAHHYIDSDAGDVAQSIQALGGAKAILATVSDAESMKSVAGGLAANGTMMVIGAVAPFEIDPLFLLRKRAAVQGWFSGMAVDSEDTLAFCRLHNIQSTNEMFPLEEAQAAYDHMMSGKARFRVVLTMP